MAVARFTASYLRNLSRDPAAVADVRAALISGRAFESRERMAVMMLDISGYSKMSADLTFLGKMASEIITVSIGSYLNQIIDVIALYSGDIVKFLGDAVLVTFSSAYSQEPEGQIILRAIACCLHIMSAHPVMNLDMKLAERSAIINGNHDERATDQDDAETRVTQLRLHCAITAGEVARVIVGDFEHRMDYFIHGECMVALGAILDATKHGEVGVTTIAVGTLEDAGVKIRAATTCSSGEHCIFNAHAVETLADQVLHFNSNTEATAIAKEYLSLNRPASTALSLSSQLPPDDSFLGKFLNESTKRRLDTALSTLSSYQLKIKAEKALSDAEGDQSHTVHVGAEFRSVTTVFVGLNFPFDAAIVQKVAMCFLRALRKYGGIFQQYAVDDKGQTLLALFGLPPHTHINNSEKCVLSMLEFQKQLHQDNALAHISPAIAMATGEILFTSVGNEYRSETSHLGDVVITAARLMGTARKEGLIVVDEVTQEHIKLIMPIVSLGNVKVKGKTRPLSVFGVPAFVESANDSRKFEHQPKNYIEKQTTFGYQQERGLISERFESWRESGRAVVFVEASSGLGKSSLANYLMELARAARVPTCLTQGTEKDQWTPFHGLQPLIAFIIHHCATTDAASKHDAIPRRLYNMLDRRSSISMSLRMLSTGTVSKDDVAASDYTNEALQKLMRRAGVDVNLAPLLAVVLPSWTMEDTDRTRALDGPARNNLLTSILTKIITAFVEDTAAVLIFDDTQWLDSSTLDVLSAISKFCPKEWKLKRLTLHIESIDPDITKAIYLKTSGNPLFLQLTLEVVVAKIGTDLITTDDHQLQVRSTSAGADSILSDLSAAVLFQFDRLNRDFQRMLKAASILGQYFVLADVLDILKLQISEEEALQLMMESDIYFFLLFPNGPQEALGVDAASEDSLERRSDEPAGTDGVRLAFRHIGILNAIYDSLSFAERRSMNKHVAGVLEGLLSDENQDTLLPSIEFHYSRTGDVDKIIHYRDVLGCRLIKNFHCVEGIRILESLIQFLSDLHEGGNNPEIKPLRRARWQSHLCAGYSVLDTYPKEKIAAINALELLDGKKWPQNKREYSRAIGSAKLKTLKLWIITSGGRKLKSPVKYREPDEFFQLRKMAYMGMLNCVARDVSFSLRDCELILYNFLNLLLMHNDKALLSLCLLKFTYYSQYFSPIMRPILYKAATRLEITNPVCYYSLAYNCQYIAINMTVLTDTFNLGTINNNIYMMVTYMEKYVAFCTMRGDAASAAVCSYHSSGVAYLAGDLSYVERVAYPKFVETQQLNSSKFLQFYVAASALRIALCRGRDRGEIERLVLEFEPHSRAFNYAGVLPHLCVAWAEVYSGDFDKVLSSLELGEQNLDLKTPGFANVEFVIMAYLVAVISFDPVRSGIQIPGKNGEGTKLEGWSDESLTRTRRVMLRLTAKTLKMKNDSIAYWALQGFFAINLALQGRARAGARRLKTKLRAKKRRAEIDYLRLIKGVLSGFVGKYSEDAAYRNMARQIFKDIGTMVFLRWVEC